MKFKKPRGCSNGVLSLGKIFFVLAILTSNGHAKVKFPEDIEEVIEMVHNACVAKSGVNEADISNCEKGIFAEDRKLGCYMFCLMEEASFVDDDNTIDYDMLISMIPDEWRDKLGKMIGDCRHLDLPEKDTCDKAMEIHKCLYKSDPDTYFLF